MRFSLVRSDDLLKARRTTVPFAPPRWQYNFNWPRREL